MTPESAGGRPLRGRFAGKVGLVTGSASGIGAAMARRLASDGAAVVLVDLARGIDDVAGTITAAGGRALAIVADVTVPAEHARVVALAFWPRS